VDGNAPIDVRHIRGRRSRVVLAHPCRRQVRAKLQGLCADDGGKQATVHRGDHEVSRKPLHREGRSVSACTCGSRALAQFLLRGSPGCSGHPAFPVPSAFPEGRDSRHNSGETRRENAAPCFFACDSGRFARNEYAVRESSLQLSPPSSWRTPGPIPRNLAVAFGGSCLRRFPGVMGPGLGFHQDDEEASLSIPPRP